MHTLSVLEQYSYYSRYFNIICELQERMVMRYSLRVEKPDNKEVEVVIDLAYEDLPHVLEQLKTKYYLL